MSDLKYVYLTPWLCLCLLLILPGVNHAQEPEDKGWRQIGRKNNVVIYGRETGSQIREIRAHAVIAAPPHAVNNVLLDLDRMAENLPHTKVSKVLERRKDAAIVYQRVTLPLVPDRDFVLRVTDALEETEEGLIAYRHAWAVADDLQVEKVAGVVRVEENKGFWFLEPGATADRTRVTYYLRADPGANLPRFLMNTVNNRMIPEVIEGLNAAANKAEYLGKQVTTQVTALERLVPGEAAASLE